MITTDHVVLFVSCLTPALIVIGVLSNAVKAVGQRFSKVGH